LAAREEFLALDFSLTVDIRDGLGLKGKQELAGDTGEDEPDGQGIIHSSTISPQLPSDEAEGCEISERRLHETVTIGLRSVSPLADETNRAQAVR
jgi:hypothetical protein